MAEISEKDGSETTTVPAKDLDLEITIWNKNKSSQDMSEKIDPEKDVCYIFWCSQKKGRTGGYALHKSLTLVLIIFHIPKSIFLETKKHTCKKKQTSLKKTLYKASYTCKTSC